MADQENQWRRDLQQAKKNSAPEQAPEAETSGEEEGALPMQPELLARSLDDDVIEEDPKSPKAQAAKMNQGFVEKIRSKTARWLLNSWLTLCATGGLAFWAWFYVAFHFTMAYIGFSKFFPKPGRELIKPFLDPAPFPEKFKRWTEEIYGSILEKFELMFSCCCCISCLTPIIVVFMVIWMFANPCISLKNLSSDLFLIAKALTICN